MHSRIVSLVVAAGLFTASAQATAPAQATPGRVTTPAQATITAPALPPAQALAPARPPSQAPTPSAPKAEEPAPAQPLEAAPFFMALSVADAEKSAAWYGEVLGFDVARRVEMEESGIRVLILRRPGALLELVQHPEARAPSDLEPPLERRFLLHGPFKLGFLVDDLDAAGERLAALGVPLRGRTFTEPDGSFRSLQVEDPDGNILQLFERLAPPWTPHQSSPP